MKQIKNEFSDNPGFLGYSVNISSLAETLAYSQIYGIKVKFSPKITKIRNSHKTEKIQRTKKWLAQENKKRLDRAKQQIEHDKVTLARKRSVYQLWQQPNGKELTNEQIEELLGEKQAEIELEEEKEIGLKF